MLLAAVLVGVTAACGGGEGGGSGGAVPGGVGSRAERSSSAPASTTPASTPATTPGTVTGTVEGPFAVGVRTVTYVDTSRPTSAVPGYAGAPERTFPVTVWYPAVGHPGDPADPAPPVVDAEPDRRGAPYPLVLFSHGYAVTPDFYEALLTRWAAAGYVVAAPAYPLLSGVPAGPSHADYREVFADHRFVLSALLDDLGRGDAAPPPGSASPLAGMVDPDRVAAAGQSDGEVAAFGAGFLQCCGDSRIAAVVAMAGNLGNVNNPLAPDRRIPVLHLLGDADELQPHDAAIAWDREHLPEPRWMLTLVGGTHAPPYRDPSSPHFDGVVEATTAFLDGTVGRRPDRLAAIDALVAVQGDRFRLER